MGYDLYGLSPQQNDNEPLQLTKLKSTFQDKSGWMEFERMSQKQKDDYFKLSDEVNNENPGQHFRNNVWWWRPLWNYVCEECQDFLSVKDMSGGGSNDGHKIYKTKALKISRRLSKLIAEGLVDKEYIKMSLMIAKAQASNQDIKKQMNDIHKEVNKNNTANDIIPAKYPEPHYTNWKTLQSQHDWDGDYPFNPDNVKAFAKFCEQSGGFEIC